VFLTRWLSFEYLHVRQLYFSMLKVGLGGLNNESYVLFLYELKDLYENKGQEVQFILLAAQGSVSACKCTIRTHTKRTKLR
jgi:hypothetical protein